MQIQKRLAGAAPLLIGVALLSVNAPLRADVLTQWDFNQDLYLPSQGAGSLSLVGGARANWSSSGSPNDPAASAGTNNGAFGSFNYDWFDRAEGVMFRVSTAGMQNVRLSFDVRPSVSASRFVALQHTLDGVNWAETVLFDFPVARVWSHNEVDYSAIAGASNNANFGVRMLVAANPATGLFDGASNSSFTMAGELRYDLVTFTGSVIPPPPPPPVIIEDPGPTPPPVAPSEVPEPSTLLLGGAGLTVLGWVRRKRKP